MIFADTSFLISLYLPSDRNSALARSIAASFRDPMAFPLLIELELKNSIWRAVGEKRISRGLAARCLAGVDRDLVDGFLQRCGLDAVAHYRKALELSEQYASDHLPRALDVLHIAAALLLSTLELASFDSRQRSLAAAVGLKLLPARLG